MFGGRNKKWDCPIGLDVGDHAVRLMQLSLRGGALRATAAAVEALPSELKIGAANYQEALAGAIRSALERGDFSGHQVVGMLPASSMQCKNLRLPMMPSDELDSAVQWEAADRFRMGEGQGSVQYLHAGQVSQGDEVRQELILLAAKREFVERFVETLTGCGLRPSAIDAIPTALSRLSSLPMQDTENKATASDARVMIDLGQSSTKVLIAVEGQVRFYKPIDLGGMHFDSALSGTLSLSLHEAGEVRRGLSVATAEDSGSAEDAKDQAMQQAALEALQPSLNDLAREIGLCLRYYGVTFRGARPERAQVVGGGASAWIAEALSAASGLTLSVEGGLGPIDLSDVRDVVQPGREGAWAVAAGLSMRNHMKQLGGGSSAEAGDEDSVFATDADGEDTKGVAA